MCLFFGLFPIPGHVLFSLLFYEYFINFKEILKISLVLSKIHGCTSCSCSGKNQYFSKLNFAKIRFETVVHFKKIHGKYKLFLFRQKPVYSEAELFKWIINGHMSRHVLHEIR